MATDINEQVANAFNAAKQALNDDLRQNLYNATQARTQAFRQINNSANATHTLYSGAPAGAEMRYDQQTYLPNIATMATTAMNKYQQNQETWDKYMEYITKLNEEANYYNSLASQASSAADSYGKAVAGFKEIPTWKANSDAQADFAAGN